MNPSIKPSNSDMIDQNIEQSQNTATTSAPTFDSRLPPRLEADRLGTQHTDYIRQLHSQPLVTTLSAFSHVANFVRNPYELINNVDEFVRHATNRQRLQQQSTVSNENIAQTLNQNRSVTLNSPTAGRELDTFLNDSLDQSVSEADNEYRSGDKTNPYQTAGQDLPIGQLPIPTLPTIESSQKRGRLEPLDIEEYEAKFRQSSTDLEIIDRIFYGGIADSKLRGHLWPYLFGLVQHRGRFEEISSPDGKRAHLFVEHEGNFGRWTELQKLYHAYQSQWQAITTDQEQRFATFRERKSLIERDVIRCDRLHPFYAEKPQNLDALTKILMTYMMYDFDIGYVQGMSDIAGPILFMYYGDTIKAFWVFVEVMKLFRRNFELTQKTIHFQLGCLSQLIKQTDPLFYHYLADRDSSNCFFAFRAIVCLFKRELMKDEEDDYQNVLYLWDSIWCVQRRQVLREEIDGLVAEGYRDTENSMDQDSPKKSIPLPAPEYLSDNPYYTLIDSVHADTPRRKLSETELFVLSLCLSMIRRERDLVMARQLDGTDLHLHFIDPKLAKDLDSFIEHAINIHSYLKNDFDLTKLTPECNPTPAHVDGRTNEDTKERSDSPPGSMGEGYDLLTDFLVVNSGDK